MKATESFWDFSVRSYRTDGVPAACLELQNKSGADVNALLFCCWLGATRGEIQTDTYNTVMTFSNNWADHVVRPLRSVRSWMKTSGCSDPLLPEETCMALRERIKRVEFESEQLQENVMQSMVESIPLASLSNSEQIRAAVFNLQHYCLAENIPWDHTTQTRLSLILQAAFPHNTEEINLPLM